MKFKLTLMIAAFLLMSASAGMAQDYSAAESWWVQYRTPSFYNRAGAFGLSGIPFSLSYFPVEQVGITGDFIAASTEVEDEDTTLFGMGFGMTYCLEQIDIDGFFLNMGAGPRVISYDGDIDFGLNAFLGQNIALTDNFGAGMELYFSNYWGDLEVREFGLRLVLTGMSLKKPSTSK